MSAHRVDMHRLQEMVRLHRTGAGTRAIARLLGMSRNTERDYRALLGHAGLLEGPPDALPDLGELAAAVSAGSPPAPAPTSSVAQWAREVEALVATGAGPTAVHDALRLKHGEAYAVSLAALKRFCQRLAKAAGPRPEDIAIPVETLPGEVAQVDFGYLGLVHDPDAGVRRKVWAFVMVLGFSRHMVVRLVFDQSVETWVRIHMEAFEELGGVPKVVVPDNLKAAVLRAAFGADRDGVALNRTYRELARHYSFRVDPTPPRSPEKKGKVESGVKYVQCNFHRPRREHDLRALLAELPAWVRTIAGGRRHGTTHERPYEAFLASEQPALTPLPTTPYEVVVWKPVRIHADSHIEFAGRLYSVPWTKRAARAVWVRATTTSVVVYADDERVATHARRGNGRRSTVDAHLPAFRRDLRHRYQGFWEERADALGPDVGAYIRAVFASDAVLLKLRPVQAIVTYLEGFPAVRANAACRCAGHFGNHTYRGIKEILTKALDLEPYETAPAPSEHGRLVEPRFARALGELVPTEFLQ